MVEPLLLVEILHGSKDSQVSSLLPEEETSTPENSAEHQHPRRLNEEYSSNTCRVCLKEGEIPIYGNEEADDIPEALLTFGGIQIEREDTYPKYLCQNCYDLLRGAILFRRTAQQSDQVLKKSCESETIEYTTELSNPGEEISAEEYEDDEEDLKVLYCKRCEIQFSEVKEYCDHRLSKEHQQKRMACTICNKSYTAAYYYKHKAIHKSDFSVACDLCGSKFVTKAQLVRHRMTHFYKLPFKCDQCPYRGRFSTCLKRHMRSHTGERPYECPECTSRFMCKSNLNKHIKTHKVDYDFKCKSCGKGFDTQKKLEIHVKVDHEGVKEHICDLCGKAFGYRRQMMKHQLKVHKREKFKSGGIPLYLQVENMDESAKQKLENS